MPSAPTQSTMSCSESEKVLGAFVDSELSPERLFEVARHAGQCDRCSAAVSELLAGRQAVADAIDALVSRLDLSATWPGLEAAIERTDAEVAWRRRARSVRRRLSRTAPVWGSLAALAAGAIFFLRAPASLPVATVASDPWPSAVRVASKPLPNHIYIDRLAGKDIALRREPKTGPTVIWVNHEVGDTTGW